jgi:hypothetical protein
MRGPKDVSEPELDRQGSRLEMNGARFVVLGVILAVPGVLLLVLGSGWVFALGLALIALALVPSVVAVACLVSGVVARWAARHRPFA